MILIVGSSGHVGSELVKKAVERGLPVRCMDKTPPPHSGIDMTGVEIRSGDITDPSAAREALQGVDTVMFAAGLKRQSKQLTHEMVETGGIRTIVSAGRETGLGHLLYISALGVSPDARAASLQAKHKAEQAIIGSGIPYTIFRPSAYFVDFAEHFAPRIRETGRFTLIGSGNTRMQPLDPADLAEAFMQSINNEKACSRIFKIAGPDVFTLNEIVHLVAKTCGVEVRITHMPFMLMNALFSAMALVTGNRGGKDFLYRMSRDSLWAAEDREAFEQAFDVGFTPLEAWLREKLQP